MPNTRNPKRTTRTATPLTAFCLVIAIASTAGPSAVALGIDEAQESRIGRESSLRMDRDVHHEGESLLAASVSAESGLRPSAEAPKLDPNTLLDDPEKYAFSAAAAQSASAEARVVCVALRAGFAGGGDVAASPLAAVAQLSQETTHDLWLAATVDDEPASETISSRSIPSCSAGFVPARS